MFVFNFLNNLEKLILPVYITRCVSEPEVLPIEFGEDGLPIEKATTITEHVSTTPKSKIPKAEEKKEAAKSPATVSTFYALSGFGMT